MRSPRKVTATPKTGAEYQIIWSSRIVRGEGEESAFVERRSQ